MMQDTSRFWLSQVLVRPPPESVLPSASEVIADALPPFWAMLVKRLAASKRSQLGGGCDPALEYGLPRTGRSGTARYGKGRGRHASATSLASGLGAHQPDRRLHLAAERADPARQFPLPTDARGRLTYVFFRFVSTPHYTRSGQTTPDLPGQAVRQPSCPALWQRPATDIQSTDIQFESKKVKRCLSKLRLDW